MPATHLPHAPPPYRPQLATLVRTPPDGADWLHEQKFDGYRIGARLHATTVELWSRRNQDWTAEFPSVVAALRKVEARNALIDGEVAAVLPSGVTSFQALQNRRSGAHLVYFVFDLLFVDGKDLRDQPLEQRKERLRALVGGKPEGVLRFSDHILGSGADFLATACRAGLEGIVSKLRASPYRAGRNDAWLKTKCLQRQEFVIGGFTDPEGSRAGIGSLVIGHYQGQRLAWAGKVGTGSGWTGAFLRDLRKRLERLEVAHAPFDPPVTDPSLRRAAHWVRPELVAEIAFAEWTADGRIRHPSMQGLREDKPARKVVRERPAAAPRTSSPATAPSSPATAPVVAGLAITHPDRIIYSDAGLTKLDIARYYDAVAERMLPHVKGRPLTLLHCATAIDPALDKGGCVMLRHAKAWGPSALRRVRIEELRKTGEYLIADTHEAVVALAQMGVVEIHTWNSTAERPYQHDRVVLDLDPGPEVAWTEVITAARAVRDALAALGLRSWLKTTGGKGLHVVAPIVPAGAAACLAFSRAVAASLAAHAPRLFTSNMAKAGRQRLILIDAFRNNRTNTSVAAYALRARPGAPVSMPIGWEQLKSSLDPRKFNVHTVPARAAKQADPWSEYWSARQALPASPDEQTAPPRGRQAAPSSGRRHGRS